MNVTRVINFLVLQDMIEMVVPPELCRFKFLPAYSNFRALSVVISRTYDISFSGLRQYMFGTGADQNCRNNVFRGSYSVWIPKFSTEEIRIFMDLLSL